MPVNATLLRNKIVCETLNGCPCAFNLESAESRVMIRLSSLLLLCSVTLSGAHQSCNIREMFMQQNAHVRA